MGSAKWRTSTTALYRSFTVAANRQVDSVCTDWRDARCRAASQAGTPPWKQSNRSAHTIRYFLKLNRLGRWERQSGEWRSRSDTNRAGLAVMAVTARLGPARNLNSLAR